MLSAYPFFASDIDMYKSLQFVHLKSTTYYCLRTKTGSSRWMPMTHNYYPWDLLIVISNVTHTWNCRRFSVKVSSKMQACHSWSRILVDGMLTVHGISLIWNCGFISQCSLCQWTMTAPPQVLTRGKSKASTSSLSTSSFAPERPKREKQSQPANVKLKLVIRGLPPNLPEAMFKESTQEWINENTVDWYYYVPGKLYERYVPYKDEALRLVGINRMSDLERMRNLKH